MNKIITILIFTSMAFSTYVQFNVDMSQQDVGQEYPTLWMGAFHPDPGFMMEDPDGDGVWSVLLDLDPGVYTYKFRNGAWQDWDTGSGWEDLLGQDCAVGQWSDREVVVGSENLQLDPVCFSSCSSDCVTVNSYEVTFQVDMNNVDGFNPSDGVYLQGTFNGWCGYCNPLSDDDGDYIYILTIPVPESEYQFLFTTMGWDGLEGGAPIGSECDYLPDDEYGNYGFLLSGQDLVLDVIPFGACPGGGDTGGGDTGGGNLLPSQVTFDLDGLDDCGFVSVTGTWDSWSGWGANADTGMSASIPAGDHEFVILCVNTEGEWWNDIWGNATVYYAPFDEPCWNGNYENPNYTLNIDGIGDSVTISYCAGSCDSSCDNGGDTGGGDDDDGIIFSGTFGGTVIDGNTYTNPTGSESWAGFANEDTDLYPLSFTDGGEITFTGATSGTDVDVYFRFEYNPHPDTEPSYNTEAVTISGADEASYSVEIPSLGENTYSSFLLYITTLDAPVTLTDVAVTSSEYVDPCTDVTCGDGEECVDGECVGTTQIDLPVDFESSTVNYTTTDFGGNISSLVIDPEDSDNLAIQVIKANQAETWAGTTIGTSAGFANNIPLSLGSSIMTVRVWSPEAGIPIRLKVEDSDDPTHTCETETNSTISGWQVLEFDFENQAPGTELLSTGLDLGWTYNMASIFFNFGTEGNDETYYFDDVEICYACDGGGNGTECGSGDVNDDGGLDVLDVVTMVNFILGNQIPSDDQICSADMNGDGGLDILDIVITVNVILNPRTSDSAQIINFNSSSLGLNFTADGYVAAIQVTITHDEDFVFNLTKKAFVAESKTENKLTKIMLVEPQDGEIFKSEGNYNIESVIAASMDGYIETQISMPTEFMITNAFPNPFNPSTNISIELNTDSDVSVKVFNVMGQLVDILSEGKMSMGIHTITWNASDFPTGIYIVNSSIDGNSQFQKIMLLK